MKSCLIFGDLSSDSAAEQYLSVVSCDACVNENLGENGAIIAVEGGYDPEEGDECHFCSKSPKEEAEEASERPAGQ